MRIVCINNAVTIKIHGYAVRRSVEQLHIGPRSVHRMASHGISPGFLRECCKRTSRTGKPHTGAGIYNTHGAERGQNRNQSKNYDNLKQREASLVNGTLDCCFFVVDVHHSSDVCELRSSDLGGSALATAMPATTLH
jgi:hypothetical protein